MSLVLAIITTIKFIGSVLFVCGVVCVCLVCSVLFLALIYFGHVVSIQSGCGMHSCLICSSFVIRPLVMYLHDTYTMIVCIHSFEVQYCHTRTCKSGTLDMSPAEVFSSPVIVFVYLFIFTDCYLDLRSAAWWWCELHLHPPPSGPGRIAEGGLHNDRE